MPCVFVYTTKCVDSTNQIQDPLHATVAEDGLYPLVRIVNGLHRKSNNDIISLSSQFAYEIIGVVITSKRNVLMFH